MNGFEQRVLSLIVKIPRGKVLTYKLIARKLGNCRRARAVGNVLAKNGDYHNFPCHRVIKSSGEIGGYNKGKKLKGKLLKSEGVNIKDNKVLNLKKYLYRPRNT